MIYKYETHLHTKESSICARCAGKDVAFYYKERGYTGIFVTDHLYRYKPDNPEGVTWAQHVDKLCAGYLATVEAGKKIGLDVFFAWEYYGPGWSHFLTYGLDKEWLLANPEATLWEPIQYFDRVHEAGGWIIHAHPFREKVEHIHLFPNKVDAVEVVNAGRPDLNNQYALNFADQFNLPHTAGSDNHSIPRVKPLAGIYSPRRLTGPADYMQAVLSKEITIF